MTAKSKFISQQQDTEDNWEYVRIFDANLIKNN